MPDRETLDFIAARAQQLAEGAVQQAAAAWGHGAALALFALGALLLLAWAFWPRDRVLTWRGWRPAEEEPAAGKPAVSRSAPAYAGSLLLLMLCAVSQQLAIDGRRGFIADAARRMRAELRRAEAIGPQERENVIRSHYLYLPEGNSLRYLSLGNLGLAADYLWLTSLQYVSSPFRQRYKFELLHRFYDTIMGLDPHWVEVLVRSGKILSALDPNRVRTEMFLMRAMTRNPGDFRLPLEAGWLYVVPPTNPRLLKVYSGKASAYLEKALGRRKLPDETRALLEDLVARLKIEAGYHQAARDELWRVATDQAAPEGIRQASSLAWLQAESLVREDLWRTLVGDFRAHHNAWPGSLTEALRDAVQRGARKLPEWLVVGASGAAPLDAYGHPVAYAPRTGEVSSTGVKLQRAAQVAGILEALAALLRNIHGRFPADLAELTSWARGFFKPPNDAPFSVVDALGEDLDCTRSPLGVPWNYDPQTGKIRLPAECVPGQLLRNRMLAFDGQAPPYFERVPAP